MLTSPIAVVPASTHMHSENISTAQIYKFTFGTSHLLAKTDQITERIYKQLCLGQAGPVEYDSRPTRIFLDRKQA